MDRQNITLALPKDVLKRVKMLAAEQGSSISALMEDLLERHLDHHEGYERAHRRQKALLDRGLDLGTRGKLPCSRDQLHDR